MKSLRSKIAAVVIAAAALVAAPAAAFATTGYTPTPDNGTTVTATPGQPITITYSGFEPNERVRFTLTGENAQGATLALVKAAVNSKSIVKTASATGDASVTITLPTNARGDYTLSAVGLSSGESAADVTINAAALPSPSPSPSGNLPATGVDSASLMGVWIGGGVLLLGGLAVTVFAVRRQRQDV